MKLPELESIELSALGVDETTANALLTAVRSAIRRVLRISARFILGGTMLLFLIEMLRNFTFTDQLFRALSGTGTVTAKFHYTIDVHLNNSDAFVVATALLAVVAAINIGVAVMPAPEPVGVMSERTARYRAGTLIWNRSLAYAVYFASLVSILVTAVLWLSAPFRDAWPPALLTSILACLTIFIAVNVGVLAEDEAEKLVDDLNRRLALQRARSGLLAVRDRWDFKESTRRFPTAIWWPVAIITWSLFHYALLLGATLALSHLPLRQVFDTRAQLQLLALSALYALLGGYVVIGLGALVRDAFRVRIRYADFPEAGVRIGLRHKLRAQLPICGVAIVLAATSSFLAANALQSRPLACLMAALAIIWLILPVFYLRWAWKMNGGLAGRFLESVYRVREKQFLKDRKNLEAKYARATDAH